MLLENKISEILDLDIEKAVLSNPKDNDIKCIKIEVSKKQKSYQITYYEKQKVFHKNVSRAEVHNNILELCNDYKQFNFWDIGSEYAIRITKKGKMQYIKRKLDKSISFQPEHNKKKKYILEEGTVIAPLVDMGVFTKDGKVVSSMYDKFKQINRFIEIIDDFIEESKFDKLNIIDFGCGKSYLTFVVYYYFSVIKNISINIVGLDLKEDVVDHCNQVAAKYNYTNLAFVQGNIDGYKANFDVNIVITLHACDTATDYAIYNAIKWDADMIFSVPCCQHELNTQINSDNYSIITRYGIAKERIASLYTDIIRCNLLSHMSYKVHLMEFVDVSHTPKNLLIRAKKTKIPTKIKNDRLKEVNNLIEEFNLNPTLYNLLQLND